MKPLRLSSSEFAELAKITPQMARKAFRRATHGKTWNGLALDVREVTSPQGGGRAGVSWKVALSSLSEELQARWRARQEVPLPLFGAPAAPRLAHGQWERQSDLYDIIEQAVRPHLTAADRAAAIRAIVAAGHAKSSVYRWIRAFEAEGMAGLARLKPRGAGERRVVASKAFQDAYLAAGHPAELLPQLAEFVDASVKGLWKGRASIAGENEVRELAGFLLFEECERLGVPVDRAACQVSTHRVDQWKMPFKSVALKNLHAKAFADSLPRIARDWTKLDPMEWVIADVKHLDVQITRPDGSTTYPKLIGFMDGGTGRIFPYLVLCPQRFGITQELVIEAFLAMAQHPEWGLPRRLYLDNGSEFGGLDKITPALDLLRNDDGNAIVRAMPYNAAAKPIEPLFRRLDIYCFASMTGYTGPNRMDKRTQNVGRAPQAYSKPWDHFCDEVGMLIAYYHHRVVKGQWNASPNDVFRAKRETWHPTFARPLALEMSFCDSDTRQLRKEGVTYKGERYHHPELLNVPIGTTLDLLVPWQRDKAPIVTLPGRAPFQLQADYKFAANDTAGSIESGRRRGAYLHGVAARDREATTIHPVDVKRRIVERMEPIALPGRARFLDQGASVHALAHVGAVIEHHAETAAEIAARRRAREDRITANLLREQANGCQ